MIGFKMKPATFKRFSMLNAYQWKTIEQCWIANMHSVLLNQDFNPLIVDHDLIRSIKAYKLWFIDFMVKGRFTSKGVILFNLDKGLKALKTLAGYFQYYLCLDSKEYNRTPPALPFWKGWNPLDSSMSMTWFGGHLRHCRNFDRRDLSDHDIANLCQIRTFGRALPCPSRRMCRNDLLDQLKILGSKRVTERGVLDAVYIACVAFSERINIGEMPTQTHFSLSTSGCFEQPTANGGMAQYVRQRWYKPLTESFPSNTYITDVKRNKTSNLEELFKKRPRDAHRLTDAYGKSIFPADPDGSVSIPAWYGGTEFLGGENDLTQLLYRQKYFSQRKVYGQELFGGINDSDPIPNEIGDALLLCAQGEAWEQGHYVNVQGEEIPPTHIMSFGDLKVPLWLSDRAFITPIRRYIIDEHPRCKLTCLAEPGAKTRPLGNCQVWFTCITRCMRFMIEPIIARDGRARIGLRSTNKMWSFLKFVQKTHKGSGTMWCQSTDYKSATDYMPLDFIDAMWRGLTKNVSSDHPFMVYYSLIASQRKISLCDYRELSSQLIPIFGIELLNNCGSFMGEPMSFMTLNLGNIVTEELTMYCEATSDPTFERVPDTFPVILGRDPTCVCGDDFTALRAILARILLFKKVAEKVGWVLSWKDQLSKRVMIFCEDHALVTQDQKLVYIDVIKSRLLTTMTRQHSDNRSSILGKGRMLRNQLDYFENKALKSSIMTVYREIFTKVYKDTLDISLPFWLPPNCGGIGFPCLETEIPKWGWKFIKYILDVVAMPRSPEKLVKLSQLRTLNSPSKKGIATWADSLRIYSEILDGYSIFEYKGQESLKEDNILPGTIYPDQFVTDLCFLAYGREVPKDPYDPSKFDFDSLNNEASLLGFIRFDELLNEIERAVNFHTFLTSDEERTQRTLSDYIRKARKFWLRIGVFPNEDSLGVTKTDCVGFTSWVKMEKSIYSSFSGWIPIFDGKVGIFSSSPSLKVDLSRAKGMRQRTVPKRSYRSDEYVRYILDM
jgi:hypothetical protein